ncbi:kinase [Thraustotheca clavata]|uniref:Kinase n=1 Tax=Thraustotheca clavata TaxID=74557 RepID=A0A1V9ZYZ8_9STRA|nr:kinase [Thraustotheca clavata]
MGNKGSRQGPPPAPVKAPVKQASLNPPLQPPIEPTRPQTPPPSKSVVSAMLETNITLRRAAIEYKDLQFANQIGQGAIGAVFKGDYHGTPVVIKKMLQSQIDSNNVALFAKEIQLLSTLRHPNIILFIGASSDPQDNLCLVMEYMESGDLWSILKDQNNVLSWKDPLLRFVVDICRGMAYLHSQEPKYIHRDLKSANILVSQNFHVAKIADFGFVRLLTTDELSLRGTPLWAAPEVLRGDTYTEKADVYSFGIVLAEIQNRKVPYHDRPTGGKMGGQRLMHDIAYNQLRPTLSEDVPPLVQSIFQRCVLEEADARPSFDQLVVEFDTLVRQAIENM